MIACDEDTAEAQIGPPSQRYDPLRHFCIARRTVPFQTSQPHCAISAQICCGPQALLAAALRTRQNRPPAVKDRRPPLLASKASRSAAIVPFARQDNQTANRISLRNCHPHKHHEKCSDPCDNALPNDHAQRPSPAQFTLHTSNRSNTRRIKQTKYQKRQRRYRR